jgi:hypothetical protein
MSDRTPIERDTKARCPKCKSRDFKVTVTETCQASNFVRNGMWIGTFDESCMPERTAAYGDCAKCKHGWRFRSAYID